MRKAMRIGYWRYHDEEVFTEHLEFIKKNMDAFDELTIFTEFSHYGYWSPEHMTQNVAILKDRLRRYREIGVQRIGINVICTLGHLDEGYDVLPKGELQYQMSQLGEVSLGCLCPSNEAFLKYIADRYAAYATLDVDYIWMDDDIRTMKHGAAKDYCYCPNCMRLFNERMNGNYTPVELWESLQNGDTQVVENWEAIQNEIMLKLFGTIRKAIKGVNPKIEIGYMTNHNNARAHWIEESGATMCRPGAGFYDDTKPIEVFEKSLDIQMEVVRYPERIDNIQYEYEAFNYQTLQRSVHISELETSLSLMSGCTGVLYNNDVFHDRQDIMDMLQGSKYKWKTLAEVNRGCRNGGVFFKDRDVALLLNEMSIPVTASFDHASVSVVLGKSFEKLSDAEIERILTKNLFTDGHGIQVLTERGFGNHLGAKVKNVYRSSMGEKFSRHEMNGEYKDYYRDAYMTFWYESDAYSFDLDANAQVISNLTTITREPVGVSMYAFENKDGRRIVADGYLMPKKMRTAAKREQLENAMEWLSHGAMPVRINKSVKVIPTVTIDQTDGCNLMLTNASFDSTGTFECVVRNTKPFYVIRQDGKVKPIKQETKNGKSILTIDNLGGWKYILLTNKKGPVCS